MSSVSYYYCVMGRGKQSGRGVRITRRGETVLLPRAVWRTQVLARDGGVCAVCGAKADAAHHIVERKLWDNGGYYLENGVALCSGCHKKAERTEISCAELRRAAKISETLLPRQFSPGDTIDKWGNYIDAAGSRYPGELFYEEQVQKALAGQTASFITKFKHPRTAHLPWSPGVLGDDIYLADVSAFVGKEVVVTEKADGESTTIGRTPEGPYCHARALDSGYHPSRTYVRELAGRIAYELPDGWRVSGENLYALHSIAYRALPDYFLVYGIADAKNCYLPYDEMKEWAEMLHLAVVPELWRGIWDEEQIRACFTGVSRLGGEQEGYVVRLTGAIAYRDWGQHVAKYVRA